MELSLTSIAWQEASDDHSLIGNLIVKMINEDLALASFQMDGVDKWSLMTILLPDDNSGYGENHRFNRKQKTLDYTLKIDYDAFSKSDYLGKAQLIFEMFFRAIDTMTGKKIPQPQINALREICVNTREKVKRISDLKKACLEIREKAIAEARERDKLKALEEAKIKTPEKIKSNELQPSLAKNGAAMKTIMISSFEDLCKIGRESGYPLDGSYELTCDIDASASRKMNGGQGFEPVGNCVLDDSGKTVLETPFTGVFDGKNFTVNGLYITRPQSDCVGLFGYIANGARIINIRVAGHLSGRNRVGGLVGFNNMCVIIGCNAAGKVNGVLCVGGLAGSNIEGTIAKCSSAVNVNGKESVGGLTGLNKGTIDTCCAIGKVKGTASVGGLVAFNGNGTITKCYATGEAIGSIANVGGLVGVNIDGTITDCYATGGVKGKKYVGGLAGENLKSTIVNCYSVGSVKGKEYTGGFVGNNRTWDGHISETVTNCYWNVTTSKLSTSDGGTGKNTSEMKNYNTYEDWNFDGTWQIENGEAYPTFRIAPI